MLSLMNHAFCDNSLQTEAFIPGGNSGAGKTQEATHTYKAKKLRELEDWQKPSLRSLAEAGGDCWAGGHCWWGSAVLGWVVPGPSGMQLL